MGMPIMNNYMTQTLILNYWTGGSRISPILQTNGTEATICWSIPPNTKHANRKHGSCVFLSGTKINCVVGIELWMTDSVLINRSLT